MIPTAGLSFKPVHFEQAMACPAAGLWFEVHAENYMVGGGPRLAMLHDLRERFPLSFHGVGLSLAGAVEPDRNHLARFKQLIDRFDPFLVSDHLAWSSHHGTSFPDLLPFPRTNEALEIIARNIDLAVFDTNIRHMEWTLTTLELARRHKVVFLDERTYRYYEDTPNSVSKSIEHALAMPEVWRRLSEGYAGTPYDAVVRRRYGTACHYVSWECVRQGKVRDAWRLHAESLRSPGGMAFVPFSVKLAFASLRQLFA